MNGKTPHWIVVFVTLVGFIWFLPIIGIVIASIRPADEVISGWWSTAKISFTLEAWETVWTKYPLIQSFWVTAKLAGFATLATMILTPGAAYAFHFLNFPFRRTLLIIVINAFVLPQQVIIIPLFQLWRSLGMIDNMFAVLIPYVGLSFAWSIFLVKNFLDDFPKELIEASKIDGCSHLTTYTHVVLPNALSPIFAVGILQFLWTWNSLLLPMLYLRSEIPLPVIFARIAGSYEPNWGLQAVAAIFTTSVPLLTFILFQKQFAGGSLSRSGNKE